MHALLQHLPDLPADARETAARRFLQARTRLDDARRDTLVQQALRVISDPRLVDLFGPTSRAEIGLGGRVTVGRQVIEIAGQIDRLAEAGDRVLIADFKTGRPRPAEATPRPYLVQLALYRAAVAPLYPERKLHVFLIWTEGPDVVELPAAALDGALDEALAELQGG
jgi:ATP-dependent helicase/nuclease subunit A